jgi:hypothetical protein
VIAVLVRNEDEIGIRHRAVVCRSSHRIDVDHLAVEAEHQGAVADEGDSQVTRWGRDDILLKGRLPGRLAPGKQKQQDRG